MGKRVETTPTVIVTSQYGNSANMERNPRHPIIHHLNTVVKDEKDDEDTANLAWLLLDNALMQSGFEPTDIAAFSTRALSIIKSGLSLESMDLLPEMEVPGEP